MAETGQPHNAAMASRQAAAVDWSPDLIHARRQEYGLIGPGPERDYPAPYFPGYLQDLPNSPEELMNAARAAVRQTAGRTPLGRVKPGSTVLWVPDAAREELVQEAVTHAFLERDIRPVMVEMHDLFGVTRAELQATIEAEAAALDIGAGQKELYFMGITGGIADYEAARDWVGSKDPLLYNATWPEIDYPTETLRHWRAQEIKVTAPALAKWLYEHREVADRVDAIFVGLGGRPGYQEGLVHKGVSFSNKFVGNYTLNDRYDLLSHAPRFPGDLWKVIEAKILEPLKYVDRVEFSDPMGTVYGFDVDQATAKDWSRAAYCSGHLFLFPSMAVGGPPYDVLDEDFRGHRFPPRQMFVDGVIASTSSHMATNVQMETHLSRGRVDHITGGGLYGDGFRLWLEYPNIQDAHWPFLPQPGFWWLSEVALGTNPQVFKHPGEILNGINLSEREVAGVIHHGFGVSYRPADDFEKRRWAKFAEETNLPMDHGMHMHQLFPTLQVRDRRNGRWITILEHGHISALEDPDVRRHAAEYGDPNDLLRRAWIPDIPGINADGHYMRDYGQDPGGLYWKPWAESISDGTYRYFR